jgi:hypothetical protein
VTTVVSPVIEALFGHGPLPPQAAVVVALALLALSANVTAGRRILHTLTVLEARTAEAQKAPSEAEVVPLRRPAAGGRK